MSIPCVVFIPFSRNGNPQQKWVTGRTDAGNNRQQSMAPICNTTRLTFTEDKESAKVFSSKGAAHRFMLTRPHYYELQEVVL